MLLGTSKACPDRKGPEPTFRVRRKKTKREWKEKRKKRGRSENRKKGESKLRLIEKPANLHRVGHDW